MSVQALSWVFERCPENVGPQPRLVLMSVANHAGPRGENSYPSVATIARETGMNPRQVQRWTAWLVAEGLLEVVVQGAGDDRIRPDRRPNKYTIVPLHRGVSSASPRDPEPQSGPVEHLSDPTTAGLTDGTAPVSPRTPERGDTHDTPQPSTGCHPRSNGVALKAPRGVTDATQTVIEPKTEPSATSSQTTSSRAATPTLNDQEHPAPRPVDHNQARDFLRRARTTITAGASLDAVTPLLEADHALAVDLGLTEATG